MNKTLEDIIKEKEEKFSNTEAIRLFGKTIVEKLEQQHQDGYPNYFKRTNHSEWQYGCVSEYIVPFENKEYKVMVIDNVSKHPLYINQIEKWEEIKDE